MKKGNHIWVINTGTALPDGCAIMRGTLVSDYAEQNELGPEDGFEENMNNYNRLMKRIKSIVEDND